MIKPIHLLLLALALLLSACATVETPGPQVSVDTTAARAAYASGDYALAAKRYLQLAATSTSPDRETLQLQAADALIKAQDLARASQLIATASQATRLPLLQERARLLSARIALAQRQADNALSLLAHPPIQSAPATMQAEYHGLRADAYALLGNHLETARALIARENYLSDPATIEANQHQIWQALSMMSLRALQQLRTAPPPDVLSGWMALVAIAKTYQLNPAQLKAHIADWRQRYPHHPVLAKILNGLLLRRQEEVAYPSHIALLLPLTGKFAQAADAIRDGFIAAYYSRHPGPAVTVRIYNTGDNPADILNIYQRAVRDGAGFIIGPLDKDAVNVLAQQARLPVPTLALNYSADYHSYPEGLYQFSLSPEDEAQQTAERTWLDGHVNGAALVPDTPWGTRIYQAFKARWEQLGGHVVSMQTYNPQRNDFSAPIRRLLSIDASRQRHRILEYLLHRKIKFFARRRQDIDFIFIAAQPRQGRLIRPQLKFYHAGTLPVYATSLIFDGTINPEMDRDMDGVRFGDMPWVLGEDSTQHSIHSQLAPYITPAGNSLPRLYAFGIDAFSVIPALSPLQRYPYERYDGETGSLSLDANHRLRRQLSWVIFRSGRPVPLDAPIAPPLTPPVNSSNTPGVTGDSSASAPGRTPASPAAKPSIIAPITTPMIAPAGQNP